MAPPPAVMPAPPPVAVAVAAPPPPPPPAPVVFAPLAGLFGPPPSGRLTLSNFSFDTARIETVITGAPDCAAREGTTTSDFVLPLNGTRVIQSVPGADVCWRRAIEAGKNAGAPPSTPGWTEWNRAYSGRAKVRINAVGFFYESPDVGAFLWALARENDGSFVGMSKP